jgi:hypothetical protein
VEGTKPWISSGIFEHVCDQNPFEMVFGREGIIYVISK